MPAMGASTWSTAAPTAISAGSTRPQSDPPPAIDGAATPPYGPPPFAGRPLETPHPDPFMPLTDLVAPNAVIPALKVNNKKQALQELAARAAALTGQGERVILEILLQREKLGSTGVGHGIAIPHGKMSKLGRLFGLFARLDR